MTVPCVRRIWSVGTTRSFHFETSTVSVISTSKKEMSMYIFWALGGTIGAQIGRRERMG